MSHESVTNEVHDFKQKQEGVSLAPYVMSVSLALCHSQCVTHTRVTASDTLISVSLTLMSVSHTLITYGASDTLITCGASDTEAKVRVFVGLCVCSNCVCVCVCRFVCV